MKHDELIGQVQARAKLSSRGDAERAVRSALETLGERIPDGLAENLASQLPVEIAEHLRRTEKLYDLGTGERFDLDEFVARVAARSGTEPPQAAYLSRVVFEVVGEATSGGVMRRVEESLPDDVRPLLTAGSSGSMS